MTDDGVFQLLDHLLRGNAFPNYTISGFVMAPASAGEIGICLRLLIMGVRKSTREQLLAEP